RPLAVHKCEAAVSGHGEARHGVVAAIRSKQKPSIRREDDAPCSLEGVRRALLTADRLEGPGTGATGPDTFHLGNRTVGSAKIMNDAVPGLVRLHVKMPTAVHPHLGWGHAHTHLFVRAHARFSSCHTCHSA